MHRIRTVLSNSRFLFNVLFDSTQSKYLLPWLKSFRQDYFLHKPSPWLSFGAIDFIQSRLVKDMRVFEYGSGGSTLFWLKHEAHLTSIEHDPTWYYKLRDHYLRHSSLDYRLVQAEYTGRGNLDPSDPDICASSDELFQAHSFCNYCSQIDEFPDEWFDIVLIDGRARASCIKHSCNKVKIGGLLVLDNSDREYYLQKTSAFLSAYEANVYSGLTPGSFLFSTTTVFTRKA